MAQSISKKNEVVSGALVRAYTAVAMGVFLLPSVLTLLLAAKLVWPDLLGGISFLNFGRLRVFHTNSLIFGWIGLSFFALLNYIVPKLANGAATGSGTEVTAHDLTAATNAASGYTIYVLGATLTSGLNTIDAIGGSATASSVGTEQFGLKVSASGGSGAAVAPYASANYAYNATTTQDDIATSAVPSTTTTYSITYIGNISATTEPGSYATTLTYTATGLF
jgi:hypothetical protein